MILKRVKSRFNKSKIEREIQIFVDMRTKPFSGMVHVARRRTPTRFRFRSNSTSRKGVRLSPVYRVRVLYSFGRRRARTHATFDSRDSFHRRCGSLTPTPSPHVGEIEIDRRKDVEYATERRGVREGEINGVSL